jgi:nicotinamidase-related amidase
MVSVSSLAALVIIDVQKGFDDPSWGRRNNPEAEKVMESVLGKFRSNGRKIIHVRHDSLNPASLLKSGKPGFEFKQEVRPLEHEQVITKHVNSAFIGTRLESILRAMGDPEIYIMGLTTDHCVSTTARMSGNLGFKTFVIRDACAAHERLLDGKTISAEMVHGINLASIKTEFAQIPWSSELEF